MRLTTTTMQRYDYLLFPILQKTITKLALYFIIPISFTGCHIVPCAWDMGYKQLSIEPSHDEMVGTYFLSEKSKQYLQNRGFNTLKYELHLYDNGQFLFINIPDLLLNVWGASDGKVMDKQGRWSISCADEYACLIEFDGISVVPITRGNSKIAIPMTIGDGDNCEGVVYERME